MGMGSAALSELARVCRVGGLVLLSDEQLARGAHWLQKQCFFRTVARLPEYTWMLDEAPINFLPPVLGDITVLQAGPYYYALRAQKLESLRTPAAAVA